MIHALIFDFDGLILETEEPVFQSWSELYQQHGCQLSRRWWAENTIGLAEDAHDPFGGLEEQLGRAVDRNALAPVRRARELELIARQSALPGVEALLQAARQHGMRIGLASSSSCEWVTGHLKRLGLLEYFECIFGSDNVEHTKPAPDLYLKALDCLHVQAHEALVLEDSPNGVLAARRAGIRCIAVPNNMTGELDFAQADLRLGSLAEVTLEALLDQFP